LEGGKFIAVVGIVRGEELGKTEHNKKEEKKEERKMKTQEKPKPHHEENN
jgi:hypothetical protein